MRKKNLKHSTEKVNKKLLHHSIFSHHLFQMVKSMLSNYVICEYDTMNENIDALINNIALDIQLKFDFGVDKLNEKIEEEEFKGLMEFYTEEELLEMGYQTRLEVKLLNKKKNE